MLCYSHQSLTGQDLKEFGLGSVILPQKKCFVWEDTSLLPTYTNWNAGEPSNSPSKGADNVIGEDCGQIVPAWAGKWNDYPCVPAVGSDKQNTFCKYGKFLVPTCMHFLSIQFIEKAL